jgi:hypothetical protein
MNKEIGIPERIEAKAAQMRAEGDPSMVRGGLWLGASWRAAQAEGIDVEEFLRWMDVGLWNLAGEPRVLSVVGVLRRIAGDKGWMLARARLSPEAALEQFYEDGAEAVLEAAEVAYALTSMAEGLPAGERLAPVAPEPVRSAPAPSEPLSFD